MTRRVVVIAPLVPHERVAHAGGQYLLRITRLLDAESELTLLAPNTPTNRASSWLPGAPLRHLVVGERRAATLAGRGLARALDVADRRRRRVDPGASSLPFAAALAAPGPARDALHTADVVSLEWSESIRLAGLVRRLAPRARLLGTYHDVQSQLFAREDAPRLRDRAFWTWASWWSRTRERRCVRLLDEVWVFSEKDAALLGSPSHARVVPPPLATGSEEMPPPPPTPRTVLFVANLARPENDEGAQWLVGSVWPSIRERHPDARLRIVGPGGSPALSTLADGDDHVSLAGFVDDLAEEYASGWAVAVPLHRGAGVKFKTVEALLHGVPVVTTSVGAEGIVGPDLFAGTHDDAAAFARTLGDVLADPEAHRRRSAAALEWARATFGADAFAARVRASYGLAD